MAATVIFVLILTLVKSSVQNCTQCSSQVIPTATHVKKLMDALFIKSYNKDVIPMLRNNETLFLDLQLSMIQIPEFDEVAGTISLIAKMKVRWMDQYIILNYLPKTHYLMEIVLQSDDVWLPPVTVFNSVESITPLMKGGYDITLTLTNGQMDINIGIVTKTGCVVDTTNFPFDEQKCKIMLTPWGYQSHEVDFAPTTTYARTDQFMENQEWELGQTSLNTTIQANRSILTFTITLIRRPIYFMINMIIPVVLLGVLNSLSFVLPPTSGERMGFSTNIFLTFAVYLTILAKNLPETSKPMSNMVYYLVIMLAVSSLTTFVTILSLRIYAKEEDNTPVPWVLIYIFGFITCRLCRKSAFVNQRRKKRSESKQTLTTEMETDSTEVKRDLTEDGATVVEEDGQSVVKTIEFVDELSDDEDEEEECCYGITWIVIGRTVDKILFLIFISGTVAISGYYILPLILGTTGVTTS